MASTAEQNLITTTDLSKAKVREIDFSLKFEESLKKMIEALGVTRKIKKEAGTMLKTRKATGTLVDPSTIGEGEIIPLSKYTIKEQDWGELKLDKYRKACSIEAIERYGYEQAHDMTSEAMLKDIAKKIRGTFFKQLADGTGLASGKGLQGALAQAWGQLQVLFEDTESTPVYFVNPLDIADYLASAAITTQTVFGMKYIEDFLGLGTVFTNTSVPQGTIYATARENVVMYYVDATSGDIAEAFDFTADPTGYIGVHMNAVYNNLTAEDVAICGVTFFAEMVDGIVVATIEDTTAQAPSEPSDPSEP